MNKIFFISGIFAVSSALAYSVKKGDTLTQIAEKHYGNWAKWQHVWKQNTDKITNPNLIFPGQVLQIANEIPGDDRLHIDTKNLVATTANIKPKKHSQEWRLLPKQKWETFTFKKEAAVDPDGFDRRNKASLGVIEKTQPNITVSSDRLPIAGEIVNARSEYSQIFLGEQVFIRAEDQLQMGTVYSVSSGPDKITSSRDQRVGFSYDLNGKIKIIGVRDGMFIGTVISLQGPIMRGDLLIPEVKPLRFKKAIPSPNIVVGTILTTDKSTATLLAEQKLVILDVGTDEGVQAGMIFRHYMKKDPFTEKAITTKDYLIESEMQVLSTSERFSIAIVLQSRSLLHANDEVVSLMDLKDFRKNVGLQTFIQDYDGTSPVDELDQLDDSQGVGEKEDKELKQLERVEPNLESDDVMVEPSGSGAQPLGEEPAPHEVPETDIGDVGEPPTVAPTPTPAPEDELDAPPAEIPSGEIPSGELPPSDLAPIEEAPAETPPADIPPAEPAPAIEEAPATESNPPPPAAPDSVVEPAPTPAASPTPAGLPDDLTIPSGELEEVPGAVPPAN